MRNYAILHIVADEAKIFTTKERAPVLLHFEAFRPEELMLLVQPENPISQGKTEKTSKRNKKGSYFKSTTELEYENYRSSSWDSGSMSEKDLAKLREPLNPYEREKEEAKKAKKLSQRRQTMKSKDRELKREAEAMTVAVGYEGSAKSKAAEVIILNNKAPSKKDRREQQEELKSKVNRLFDIRASDPLIINSLKRVSLHHIKYVV